MFGFTGAKLLFIGAAVVALLALCSWAYNSIGDAREQKVRAEWMASDIRLAEESRKAVESAITQAHEDAKNQENQRKANEQVEREKQANQAEHAAKTVRDLDRRYRDALIHNASCAAQMEQIVLCPLE